MNARPRIWIQLALASLALAAATAARAQVVAPGGRTMFNRGVMVRSLVRLDSFDENSPGLRVRRVVNRNALVWGAYPHLSLTFMVPVVSVDREVAGDPAQSGRSTGTDDGMLFARYDAYRKLVPAGFTRLAPEIGVKLPTGGAFGSGSTDYSGALVFSHVRDRNWFVADAQYTYRTTGDGGLRQGDRWRFDAAYLRQLHPREGLGVPGVLLVLELNAEALDRARVDGLEQADSGGSLLFFSPGLQVFASRRMVVELSVPVRVHSDPNGSQVEPTHSVIAGVRLLM